MNEKGNRYALAALKDERATLAGEIIRLRRQVRSRQDALAHVDACIRLLDPGADPSRIPHKRRVQRVRLFKQGELGRLILDVLRRAARPLKTADIVTAVLKAKGASEGARQTMAPRVRANLAYLSEKGSLLSYGEFASRAWELRAS